MEQETKVVFELTSDSHLIAAIALINKKSADAGKPEHSVEYWCEELLARGVNAYSNYLDADKDRRNRESYVREMAKLTVPNAQDAEAMAKYAERVSQLGRKFRIGGTQVAL